MKTKPTLLTAAILVIASCDDSSERSTPDNAGSNQSKQTYMLRTELPPELIEGTPVPMRFSGFSPKPVPLQEAQGPGTSGVFYAPREESSRMPAARNRVEPQSANSERYGTLVDNQWQNAAEAPLSTFSVDVDTASYANVRRMILDNRPIPRDAVRLEEWVNYFDYAYGQPEDDQPFAVHVQNATCPWNTDHQLVRVALKGRDLQRADRAPANLVFLLDVSGSMQDSRKLPLVAQSLQMLVEELGAADSLAIVVYAGAEGLLLPATACDGPGRQTISAALNHLQANGSTNGGAGIKLAYQIARQHFKPGGINRVILATDGDFNVGVTRQNELIQLAADNAKSNVDLTVLGVGSGNLNDSMLEEITNRGNGTYYYIDSLEEARRVFLQKMMGTLVTIAKDVKIQLEFNPVQVRGYRLLGYANRMLRKEDFANDLVDAGDIGSGHTVTAFYEIETTEGPASPAIETLRYDNRTGGKTIGRSASREWLTVKLRYKIPGESTSTRFEHPFIGSSRAMRETDADFRFASAVAMTSLIFRETEGMSGISYEDAATLAKGALDSDPFGHRAEFVRLLDHVARNPGQTNW